MVRPVPARHPSIRCGRYRIFFSVGISDKSHCSRIRRFGVAAIRPAMVQQWVKDFQSVKGPGTEDN